MCSVHDFPENLFMWRYLSKPFILYLFKFGGLFSLFYFGTLLIIGFSSKENLYSEFIDNYIDFVSPLRQSILQSAKVLFHIFGYTTTLSDEYTLGLKGGHSVRMVYSCVGYGVLSFWSAFVLSNHGNFLKKIIWLLFGWLLLWCLNVCRVFLLIIAINKAHQIPFGLDHHTLFNVVAYGFIFLLIYFYDRS